jgi:hypothetical protein
MAASDSYGSNYYSSANSSYPSWDKSVKYKYSGGSSQGGNNMLIGPEMVIGGVGALVQGIGGAFGANAQAASAERMANRRIEAEERARFQSLLAGQNANTYGKQFEMGLQRDAANYQQAFLDPRKSILSVEDLTRRSAAELGSFGQRLRQQSNRDEIQRTLAGKYSGAVGQIYQNPFMFGQTPGYASGSLV